MVTICVMSPVNIVPHPISLFSLTHQVITHPKPERAAGAPLLPSREGHIELRGPGEGDVCRQSVGGRVLDDCAARVVVEAEVVVGAWGVWRFYKVGALVILTWVCCCYTGFCQSR